MSPKTSNSSAPGRFGEGSVMVERRVRRGGKGVAPRLPVRSPPCYVVHNYLKGGCSEVGVGLCSQALDQVAQGGGGVTIPGGVQKTCGCGTWGHGLAGMVGLG